MKQLSFLFTILMLVTLCACTSIEQPPEIKSNPSQYVISKAEALSIAGKLLGKDATESRIGENVEMRGIKNQGAKALPDTIAYVVNYSNDGGFAIISADNRMDPVLAYSESGEFSFDNEIVKTNFIDRLEGYMAYAVENPIQKVGTAPQPEVYQMGPVVTVLFSSGYPFNRYLSEIYGPNTAPGCGPVAIGTMMIYCGNTIQVSNNTFDLQRIRNGLVQNGTTQPRYSYDIAGYEASKLIGLIGEDLHIDYANGNYAMSDGYNGLMQLFDRGFKSPVDYYSDFPHFMGLTVYSLEKAVSLLDDQCILYTWSSYKNNHKYAHAWVIDGYRCNIHQPGNRKMQCKVHCRWGWGGKNDGYYTGEVFAPTPDDIFADINIAAFYNYKKYTQPTVTPNIP